MKTLIIFNHPYEGSFCNAIMAAVMKGLEQSGQPCDVINLDKDGFDPVMRSKDLMAFVTAGRDRDKALSVLDPLVISYKKKLEWAEHLVMIFPVWWMTMPAMTKGFVDKVIFPAIAYDMQQGQLKSRLSALEKVTVISTMNTPAEVYRNRFGNALEGALIRGTFNQIGIMNVDWLSLDMVRQVDNARRQQWLEDIGSRFAHTI